MPKKHLTGTEVKKLILRTKYLPDHPEPFRKQMVTQALIQEGADVNPTTLDMLLLNLLSLGYLVRSEEPETAGTFQPFMLWMFAHPDRTSDRKGWRTGDPHDLWKEV
jgi:hypothetical protein